MDFLLNEDQVMIRDTCREIVEEHIKPVRAKYDEEGIFPWDIVEILRQADIFGVYIPEEYGGFGGGVLENAIVVEELSRGCGGIALAYGGTGLGTYPILLFGSDEQKQRFLPDIATGKRLAAFSLTEANAGSDVGGIETTAEKDGNYYILNGTKQWITNGSEAEVYSVFAMTDKSKGPRGASAFIVEKDTPGFTFGKKENKMGIRASATSELIFQDCRIPQENLLGREGMGFIIAMKVFDKSRPGIAAQALGIAQAAFEEAVAFVKEREQFGKPVSSFQGVQFMLADMATKIATARSIIYTTARMIDSGAKDITMASAMCKMYSSDIAMEVTTDAVQLLGGSGYMKEYPVEKMMRDAKITQIYEGTNQIMRQVIGLEILKKM
ncbi:MAG: acyl-CoA dehydrogenase family protein [Candidatus Latescibacteria bacterium]|nr:acyl-CoA dehydrogenase family protein [Candidatus Latescibacterota bacterium]